MIHNKAKRFEVGDVVRWPRIHPRLGTVMTDGVVVAVVPEQWDAWPIFYAVAEEEHSRIVRGTSKRRDHESYLVKVEPASKAPQAKGTIYWPRVKSLELAQRQVPMEI